MSCTNLISKIFFFHSSYFLWLILFHEVNYLLSSIARQIIIIIIADIIFFYEKISACVRVTGTVRKQEWRGRYGMLSLLFNIMYWQLVRCHFVCDTSSGDTLSAGYFVRRHIVSSNSTSDVTLFETFLSIIFTLLNDLIQFR